jgi:hypothetical protein
MGYAVVLLGVVGFLAAVVLPYVGPRLPPESLYRLSSIRTFVGAVGLALYLFAGMVTLAWVAVSALRRPRGWHPQALVVIAIVWSATWLGWLLVEYDALGTHSVWYWVLFVSVAVVILGAVVVFMSSRTARSGGD